MPSISHPAPVVRHTGPPPPVPNTSQLPPGYSQQSIQPISTHFGKLIWVIISEFLLDKNKKYQKSVKLY